MGMLVVTALVTFFVQRQELWSIGKKAAVKMAGTAVVDVLAPGLHYEEKENGNHFLPKWRKYYFQLQIIRFRYNPMKRMQRARFPMR